MPKQSIETIGESWKSSTCEHCKFRVNDLCKRFPVEKTVRVVYVKDKTTDPWTGGYDYYPACSEFQSIVNRKDEIKPTDECECDPRLLECRCGTRSQQNVSEMLAIGNEPSLKTIQFYADITGEITWAFDSGHLTMTFNEKIPRKQINLNDNIWFKPTLSAEIALINWAEKLVKDIQDGSGKSLYTKKEYIETTAPKQPDGTRKMQLWMYMQIFGSFHHNGNENFAENCIMYLEEPKP